MRRYDQLNGGLGNLLNRFDPQLLDFAVARYRRTGLWFFDSLSLGISYNGQRDDRTFQNINNSASGVLSRITNSDPSGKFNQPGDQTGMAATCSIRCWEHYKTTAGQKYRHKTLAKPAGNG